MNIFLTGATGYIGSTIAEKLQERGHTIVGLAHSEKSIQQLIQRKMQIVQAGLQDTDVLAQAALNADVTIHSAASRDPQGAAWEQQAVAAMLNALYGTGKGFLYTSGVSVVGDTGDQVLDETAPPSPGNWRAAVEHTVMEASTNQVRGVVIRPSFVYGRDGGILARLVSYARNSGVAGYIEPGTNQWSFVHVDDLADLYVGAAELAPPGTVYNAADEVHSLRALAEQIAQAIPTSRITAWTLEQSISALGPIANLLRLNMTVSGDKARREIGWQPAAPAISEEITNGRYAGTTSES